MAAGQVLVPAALPCYLLAAVEISPGYSRLGMNLSGLVDWNTEHPFGDVFRLSRQRIGQAQGQPWGKGPQLELDQQGWMN
jgi:hypothetical protein